MVFYLTIGDTLVVSNHTPINLVPIDQFKVDSSKRTNVSDNGEGTEVTEVEQGESREEQTLSHEISTFSSDDDSSSCTEESSSSESKMSEDGVNEPTHGRGRKV